MHKTVLSLNRLYARAVVVVVDVVLSVVVNVYILQMRCKTNEIYCNITIKSYLTWRIRWIKASSR